MENYLAVLEKEFRAEDGSFLLQLRVNLIWDKEAFLRLSDAMKKYCENHSQETKVDKWIAEGFWWMQLFTRDWSSHPNFPRKQPPEYYEKACKLLDDLAYWFFIGQSPYRDSQDLGNK
jgi:hypothetical protein